MTQGIKLPPEFFSANDVPVERATIKRERMIEIIAAAIEPYAKRIAELESARMAYASEFPSNEDGEPDVGRIHENIRKLKTDRQQREKDLQLCEEALEVEMQHSRRLQKGLEELKADRQARGEPVAWLRNERGGYDGEAVFDPLVILGSAPPTETVNGATYAPVYAAPQPPQIPEGYKLVPQRLINLCEQFTKWRNCMSYNDSYFGEPDGDLKRIAAAMERAMLESAPEVKPTDKPFAWYDPTTKTFTKDSSNLPDGAQVWPLYRR